MRDSQHAVANQWSAERVKRLGQLLIRRATWKRRSLPHFIIIGAMKCGTSSLFYYLVQHPQILPTFRKEVHFFDAERSFRRGERWYRAHFPLERELGADAITGEATPMYLFHPLAADRIYEIVPDAKLVAILRNPTERAISHYFHEVRRNREQLPIVRALGEEDDRIGGAVQKNEFHSYEYVHFTYKARGLYRQQLERYWKRFSSEQLLVLNSEAFFREPRDTLRTVFSFLGVDEQFEVSDLEPRAVGSNRAEVGPEVYAYLEDYFSPHNQALFQRLGRTFDW